MTLRRIVPIVVAAMLAAGCAQPGTQASHSQAATLDVASRRMSSACGYAFELTAFGGPQAPGRPAVEAMAIAGARRLARMYAHDQGDLYQGESIGALVKDSISLLGDCGLDHARMVLVRALTR